MWRVAAVCLLCVMPMWVMAQGVNEVSATDVQTKGIVSYVQHVMGFNRAVPQEKVYMHAPHRNLCRTMNRPSRHHVLAPPH